MIFPLILNSEISSNERTKMVQPKKYGLKIRNKVIIIADMN